MRTDRVRRGQQATDLKVPPAVGVERCERYALAMRVAEDGPTRSSVVVCLGPAHIEVRAGFDPHLLRDVVVALGGDA